MRNWMKRHWKLTVLICFVLVGGCTWSMLEVTHDPDFCKGCHVMEPYYFAWEESGHAGVSCVKCHYPPGLMAEIEGKKDALNQLVSYATGRIGTKFHAEIPDESCLRSGCHDTRIDNAVEEYQRGIRFDHSHHYGKPVRDIELRCTSCHSQIVQGSHIAVTPSTCFTCHFRNKFQIEASTGKEFCLKCHDFPSGLVTAGTINYNHADYVNQEGVLCWQCHSDVVRGNGEVEDRACLQCHDHPDQLSRITDVKEVHLNHVTKHKVECFNCHSEIEHSVPEVLDEAEKHRVPNCYSCHEGLHDAQAQLYAGIGGRGVPETPSAMYQVQVDCGGCHRYQTTHGAEVSDEFPASMEGETTIAMEQSCVACHDELGAMVLESWRETMGSEVAETEALVSRMDQLVKQHGLPTDPALVARLSDARHNLNLVKYGRGEHNFIYALDLLKVSRDYASEVISSFQ